MSLARPGRKQATAIKLGIYSTYSLRSPINFLFLCSFTSHSNKKFRNLSVQPGLHGCNDLPVGKKMVSEYSTYFQSREQVVVRRGQIRRMGWVIKILEAQVGQFLMGCKCPVSRGIVIQEQNPLGEIPAAFFLQNALQFHQQR